MGIQSFVYWVTQKFNLNAIFGRNHMTCFFFKWCWRSIKFIYFNMLWRNCEMKTTTQSHTFSYFPYSICLRHFRCLCCLFLYRFIVSFSINRSILFMRKQLTSAKLWAECLFQCVRMRMRANVRIFCAGSRHYSLDSILSVSDDMYMYCVCILIWMNWQNTVIATVPLNVVCINHTNETSTVHHFSLDSRRFECVNDVCGAVNVLLLHVICCYSISLSSVSSFTFIVFYSHFYIFRKPPNFLYPFRSLLHIHGVCFFGCFIFSYSQIVILFYIACAILFYYTLSHAIRLWFESILNLEISSYFCNQLQCRMCENWRIRLFRKQFWVWQIAIPMSSHDMICASGKIDICMKRSVQQRSIKPGKQWSAAEILGRSTLFSFEIFV